MKKYKVILLSGGFDPVHKGHVEWVSNHVIIRKGIKQCLHSFNRKITDWGVNVSLVIGHSVFKTSFSDNGISGYLVDDLYLVTLGYCTVGIVYIIELLSYRSIIINIRLI